MPSPAATPSQPLVDVAADLWRKTTGYCSDTRQPLPLRIAAAVFGTPFVVLCLALVPVDPLVKIRESLERATSSLLARRLEMALGLFAIVPQFVLLFTGREAFFSLRFLLLNYALLFSVNIGSILLLMACSSLGEGGLLLNIAQSVASERARVMVLEPVIADMQFEYDEAMRAGRRIEARLKHWRGVTLFWQHLFACLGRALVQRLLRSR